MIDHVKQWHHDTKRVIRSCLAHCPVPACIQIRSAMRGVCKLCHAARIRVDVKLQNCRWSPDLTEMGGFVENTVHTCSAQRLLPIAPHPIGCLQRAKGVVWNKSHLGPPLSAILLPNALSFLSQRSPARSHHDNHNHSLDCSARYQEALLCRWGIH